MNDMTDWPNQKPGENTYVKLAAVNVNGHIEKKNGLSYLSWAWAVDQLLRLDPTANWTFHDPKDFNGTLMVSCTVTAFNLPRTCHLPVMDYKNKAIPKPNAFEVNTAMQRCLVKAIALHGLGLYIYAGEDIPPDENGDKPEPEPKNGKAAMKPITPTTGMLDSLEIDQQNYCMDVARRVERLFAKGDLAGATDEWESEAAKLNDMSEFAKAGTWSLIDSKARSAIKAEQVRRKPQIQKEAA